MRITSALLLLTLTACPTQPMMVEVFVLGTGRGTVEVAGKSCGVGEVCEAPGYTTVVATATAHDTTEFLGWFGEQCKGRSSCTAGPFSERAKLYAAFAVPGSLVVSPTGGGDGVIEGAGIACGAGLTRCGLERRNGPVELKATANPNSLFEGWGGACEGLETCVVPADGTRLVTARFTRQVPLMLTVTGPGTLVAVELGLTCTATCTRLVPSGTKVLVRRIATADGVFGNWNAQGAPVSEDSVMLTVERAMTVAAFFYGRPLSITATPHQVMVPGQVELKVVGGTKPYTLQPNGGSLEGTTLTVTSYGQIEVSVRDATGQFASTTIYGLREEAVTGSIAITPTSASLRPGETVRFHALSGTPPMRYTASAGTIDSTGLFTAPLSERSATVTVRDAVGAAAVAYIDIDVAFTVSTQSSSLIAPGISLTGDLDHDGRTDALTTLGDSVWRVRFDGAGTAAGFSPLMYVPDAGAVAMTDWNDDGRTDLFYNSGALLSLALITPDGGITFHRSTVMPHRSEQLVPAVLDEENELAIFSRGEGRISLVRATDGGFEAQQELDQLSDAVDLAVADVNRDGRTDLLVQRSNRLELRVGLGAGRFDAPRQVTTHQSPLFFTVADFTADGWVDVLVAHGRSVTLFVNQRGTLTALPEQALTVARLDALGSLHWNFDSRRDGLVVSGDTAVVLEATASGVFRETRTQGLAGTRSVLTGDWNRDGQDDLLLLGPNGLLQLRNQLNQWGQFSGLTRSAALQGSELVTGDWNRDGRTDLAWVTDAGVVSALSTTGGPTPVAPFQPGATDVVTCDWNRDAISDLVVTHETGVSVFFGAGDGSFSPGPNVTAPRLTDLITADWNGDGRVDLAGIDPVTQQVNRFIQADDGALVTAPAVATRGATAIASGDVDGDGLDELVVAEADVDGEGEFNSPGVAVFDGDQRRWSIILNGVRSVLVVDANRDGLLDVAVGSAFGIYLSTALPGGTGLSQGTYVNGTTAGDALVVANMRAVGEPGFWWDNDDGTASLARGPYLTPSSVDANSLATGDFNGDGLEDLAALSSTTGLSIWSRR